MAARRLETKQAFRALTGGSPMVITDSAGSPRFHPGFCEHLTTEASTRRSSRTPAGTARTTPSGPSLKHARNGPA